MFILAGLLTDWAVLERLIVALAFVIVADLSIAAAIQASAPTTVNIGPGERALSSELPSEMARVIGGFDTSTYGRVIVRGETWQAIRAPEEKTRLRHGMDVNVVARDGLTLVVSSNSR